MEPFTISEGTEQSTSAPSRPKRHHGILFWLVVVIVAGAYVAGNAWLYLSVSGKRGHAPTTVPSAIRRFYEEGTERATTTPGASSGQRVTQPSVPGQPETRTSAPTPTATPTPTPRPTGPGHFACSAEGDCNLYSDEARKQYCSVTYADNRCLDACGDPATRCRK